MNDHIYIVSIDSIVMLVTECYKGKEQIFMRECKKGINVVKERVREALNDR